MTSSQTRSVKTARRFIWLALAIVAVVVLYTFGWFYAADRLTTEAQAAIARMSSTGDRTTCENMEVRGYPFRIGLFCGSVFVERRAQGITADAGALRSAAQIYAPRRVIAELDGPARLVLPQLLPLEMSWKSLRASARLALPLPERTSLVAESLHVEADTPGAGNSGLLDAEHAELHLRPAGADVELGIRARTLTFGPLLAQGRLPRISGVADLVLLDGKARIAARDFDPHGTQFDIRRFDLNVDGGGQLTVTGPLSIGDDGLIDAELQVKASDAAALLAIAANTFPDMAEEMQTLGAGLAALGANQPLPLRIRDGSASLGFIQFGSIPPL